jgi:membrane-associated phospholipid phosphatase
VALVPFFTLREAADMISQALNPAFVLLFAQEPLLHLQPETEQERVALRRWVLWFWVRCAFSVGLAVLCTKAGKHFEIWPGRPGFPSGHTTFTLAGAYCLVAGRGLRWLPFAAVLVLIMAASILIGGWHTPVEVAGAFVPGLGIPFLVWRITARLAPKIQTQKRPLTLQD